MDDEESRLNALKRIAEVIARDTKDFKDDKQD